MPEQTSIFYVCHKCTTVSKELRVTAREKNDADVVKWMQSVSRIIQLDHTFNNPGCIDPECVLLMPVLKGSGERWVGMPCEPGAIKIPADLFTRKQ